MQKKKILKELNLKFLRRVNVREFLAYIDTSSIGGSVNTARLFIFFCLLCFLLYVFHGHAQLDPVHKCVYAVWNTTAQGSDPAIQVSFHNSISSSHHGCIACNLSCRMQVAGWLTSLINARFWCLFTVNVVCLSLFSLLQSDTDMSLLSLSMLWW